MLEVPQRPFTFCMFQMFLFQIFQIFRAKTGSSHSLRLQLQLQTYIFVPFISPQSLLASFPSSLLFSFLLF
jgi:hypothetical protein